MMQILGWIIFGALTGWIAGKIVNRRGEGCMVNTALGLLGAVTGLDFFASDPEQIRWRAIAVQFAVDWLYEAGLTASPLRGTLGKHFVG